MFVNGVWDRVWFSYFGFSRRGFIDLFGVYREVFVVSVWLWFRIFGG